MDTSETYIKMCDCEEIQKEVPFDSYGGYEHRLWFTCSVCHEIMVEDDGGYFGCSHVGDAKLIWLPRQDQLQEMVSKGSNEALLHCFYEFLHTLVDGVINYVWHHYKSMEQLWIAFVMRERYNKTWSGTEWIKEE